MSCFISYRTVQIVRRMNRFVQNWIPKEVGVKFKPRIKREKYKIVVRRFWKKTKQAQSINQSIESNQSIKVINQSINQSNEVKSVFLDIQRVNPFDFSCGIPKIFVERTRTVTNIWKKQRSKDRSRPVYCRSVTSLCDSPQSFAPNRWKFCNKNISNQSSLQKPAEKHEKRWNTLVNSCDSTGPIRSRHWPRQRGTESAGASYSDTAAQTSSNAYVSTTFSLHHNAQWPKGTRLACWRSANRRDQPDEWPDDDGIPTRAVWLPIFSRPDWPPRNDCPADGQIRPWKKVINSGITSVAN